jgi:glutathione peroxidase-family protein
LAEDYGRKPKDLTLRFEVQVTETEDGASFDVVSVGTAWSVACYLVMKTGLVYKRLDSDKAPVEATDAILKALDMADKQVKKYARSN